MLCVADDKIDDEEKQRWLEKKVRFEFRNLGKNGPNF